MVHCSHKKDACPDPSKTKKRQTFSWDVAFEIFDRTVMTLIKLSLAITASSMSFSLYVSLNGLSDFFRQRHTLH